MRCGNKLWQVVVQAALVAAAVVGTATATAEKSMIGRTCTSFNIRHQPFAAVLSIIVDVNVAVALAAAAAAAAALPAKGAVVDRLLTSQLPNEIMIMNTMAPGEWPTIQPASA